MRIGVGLLGFGTVGSGVYRLVELRKQNMRDKMGCDVFVKKVLIRDPKKTRAVPLNDSLFTTIADDILSDDGVNLVVEAIGGVYPAREYVEKAIKSGKDVVTANKELIAKHGRELLQLAKSYGVDLRYEATVAGAIPVIRQVRRFKITDEIDYIGGILNGTCNYILTQMELNKWDYGTALKEAQRLGYAESDPSYDVQGYDSLFKLMILIREVFDIDMDVKDIEVEGIAGISKKDVEKAKARGQRIKLYAWAKKNGDEINAGVKPEFFPVNSLFGQVNGVENAVVIKGDGFGQQFFVGYGAGQMPTGDAVLSDIVDILGKYERTAKG
ncbi:homoserine dehydrogenase, partial [Caldanaerobius polysaccharolyticus]|uniref:homoserine dehydrogenase n=1 Tax=Caldanaerobius polysaccharolyticus TaxID=44256 RepID=UPI00054CE807